MAAKKKRRPVGETIGGMIVGFDYQVFRTTPPPHELVQKAKPVRALSGEDGSTLLIGFPDEEGRVESELDDPAGQAG